ncbi:MAG: MMPL family transporter [Pseudomonadota bacterium]
MEPKNNKLHPLLTLGLHFPRKVIWITSLVVLAIVALATLPSLWPQGFPGLNGLSVDTDPENMLPIDQAERVFHRDMKQRFALHDMIVVGVTNDSHPQGVFNAETLQKITELVSFAGSLNWPSDQNPGETEGVIDIDLLAPSTVDFVTPDEPGTVRFEWLMQKPPETDAEALVVRDRLLHVPLLRGTMVSRDGKSLALYIPLTSKHTGYRVHKELAAKVRDLDGEERYFFTGLPIAEDTFGVDMFIQMGISAPAAMLVIFLLMWFFFRRLALVAPAMIVALFSVLVTMGLLVITGNTVHIMSSMIPIFIMPIAVLDSVHILSHFFDDYRDNGNRHAALAKVIDHLYRPMLFTSLTTAAGFASLALAPIPPVQVFGLFVAFGVLLAWVLTISFIPAYVQLLPEARLGAINHGGSRKAWRLSGLLHVIGEQGSRFARPVVALGLVLLLIGASGIRDIEVNDNPVRWFVEDHPIRLADDILNEKFSGSYMAYLALTAAEPDGLKYLEGLRDRTNVKKLELSWIPGQRETFNMLIRNMDSMTWDTPDRKDDTPDRREILKYLRVFSEARLLKAVEDEKPLWREVLLFLDEEEAVAEVFKRPEALRYIERLQEYLQSLGTVGNTSALPDIVKTVYRDLISGDNQDYRIPDSRRAVAQTLLVYQNSHRPQDLWHFVDTDYRATSLWVQMTSGDNQDVSRIVTAVDRFIADHPPPFALQHQWFGLSYINVVWQELMVKGMLEALIGSFGIVLLMLLVLLRSGLWALLAMVPLTLTLITIYGIIGLAGIDYDMPIAVLSALSLGLAVDFAIHFLVQTNQQVTRLGSWQAAASAVFGAPARAITRNGIVISVGFLPLLLAPLVPYQTVGLLIASILLISGGATLILLAALMRLLEPWLFPQLESCTQTCNQITCLLSATTLILVLTFNLYQFSGWTLEALIWPGGALLVGAMFLCRRIRLPRTFRAEIVPDTARATARTSKAEVTQ